MIVEIAPAKINLYLHVGPARRDGLHDLASAFVFADRGDILTADHADRLTLEIDGPFAGLLRGGPMERNLVWRAADALRIELGRPRAGAALRLSKRLPVAAGIGGGSADAAAALRALCRLWSAPIPEQRLRQLAFALGADVPACLRRAPVDVCGAGEVLSQGPALPPLWATLVNAGEATPTGPIFRAFDRLNPCPPAPALTRRQPPSYAGVRRLMAQTRNDLEPAARAHAPSIAVVSAVLEAAPGLLAARLSGSGATVFGLFSSRAAAQRASHLARGHGWWSLTAQLLR